MNNIQQNTKKIALITGITGQDGSYLAEFLLNKGYEVHGIKRRASSFNQSRIEHIYEKTLSDENEDKPPFYIHYGDVTDLNNLIMILNKIKPDEFYNLAAQSHVHTSFEMPVYTANVDGLGTLNCLEAIRQSGLNNIKFYQASTSELYGKIQDSIQNENTPFYPRSPYACAKLMAYWFVINYREAYNLFAVNGILFNHETITGDTPMIYKIGGNNKNLDIKPISEIVKYHTLPNNNILIDENNDDYQEGNVLTDLYVWDNNNWTKVKFASAYKHDIKNNPKYPKKIITKNSCYMATNTHHIIMDDGKEKKLQDIKLNDKVKLVNLPSYNNNDNLDDFEAEFIGLIVGFGYINNAYEIGIINDNKDIIKHSIKLFEKICKKYNKECMYKYIPIDTEFENNFIVSSSGYIIFNKNCYSINKSDIYNEDCTKRIPSYILNGNYNIKINFLKGISFENHLNIDCPIYNFKNFKTNSQVIACGIIYLIKNTTNQQYNINVETKNISNSNKIFYNYTIELSNNLNSTKSLNTVKNIIKDYEYDGWFYDLETESGTFFCGIGQGLVHNSPRRGETFVTKKITMGVAGIKKGTQQYIKLGNVYSNRDWGHAKDYVECMWLMLQQEKPQDFVIATGETHTVKEFCDLAFKEIGIELEWRGEGIDTYAVEKGTDIIRIKTDPKYFRPTEVDFLLGNPEKAKTILGWNPLKTSFNDLIKEMVQYDINNN
jgi:GDP-mannose 4,6-dehydratase